MYILDKFELYCKLAPVLGINRAKLASDIASEELAVTEQWVMISNMEFSMVIKDGYFTDGDHQYRGINGGIYRSRRDTDGTHYFYKWVGSTDGKPAKGWFGRIIYKCRQEAPFTEEEGSLIFRNINTMIMRDLGIAA